MANLGNAWHIPKNAEPRGGYPFRGTFGSRAGMRDPAEIVPGMDVTIVNGNQFQGNGNPGNQLEDGSSLFFKRAAEAAWTELPLRFRGQAVNNKYFAATIPAGATQEFAVGENIAYYLRIPYSDHDTTFLHARDDASATTADESVARATPFTFTLADPAVLGRWDPVFTFPNVAIHTHVLPNGRVLMWGRRKPGNPDLDVVSCTPFVWNPAAPLNPPDPQNPAAPPAAVTIPTAQPRDTKGTRVNLFCSGHAFLPDGRLLVVGGHIKDSDGLNQATTYTPAPAGSDEPGTWTPVAPMRFRRWYPTATTLPNGSVLVMSGSFDDDPDPKNETIITVPILEVFDGRQWRPIPGQNDVPVRFNGPPLYPRMHVISDGQVFMSGTDELTQLLKHSAPGGWTPVRKRKAGARDYAPAVMFDQDKILYIGGGNKNVGNAGRDVLRPPTNQAETIDLSLPKNKRKWSDAAAMAFPRRQHNAVILPDGTVLVIGGTRGGGGARKANTNVGFNDLKPGRPVHAAELWDPQADNDSGRGAWQTLAAEEIDRCYHSTAVLLPDARVLSAGGGEYNPGGFGELAVGNDSDPNDPADTHQEAQIFSPPYLFKGDRPVITSAPASVRYGQTFEVHTPDAADIATVSWVRVPSVTHSFDENQRINFLASTPVDAGTLAVTAPDTPQLCPPGHYMLFILHADGVPSKAAIIQVEPLAEEIAPAAVAEGLEAAPIPEAAEDYGYGVPPADTLGTQVVIGLTGTCPYGIGACWGGAYDALGRLDGVGFVNPVPDTADSTAEVFLSGDGLPDLNTWTDQFYGTVNGSYQLHGFEVTVRGAVSERDGQLFLTETADRPEVQLGPLSIDKVQTDRAVGAPQAPGQGELRAYDELAAAASAGGAEVTVTGPLTQTDSRYRLHVRALQA
jgi:hypothetical protein